MDLSIIIVNWNSKDYLRKCIASVLENTTGIEYEIVVIDSGSFDGCGEMLRENYPFVRFIQSDTNLGFARANNRAFQNSTGDCVLFLNPDTELVGPAINSMYDQLQTLPSAGIVGAKLLNSDGTIQTSCIQSFPGIINQVLDTQLLRHLFPRWRLWGTAALFDTFTTAAEIDAVSGACLMIKRSLFQGIGMFSVDYFMYSEDIDLCFNVRQRGVKSYYVPLAVVLHHGGASSAQSCVNTFSSVMMMESRWRFFRKTRSNKYIAAYRLAIFSSAIIRTFILLIMLPPLGLVGKASAIEAPLKKWLAIMRWTVGLEKWVKRF